MTSQPAPWDAMPWQGAAAVAMPLLFMALLALTCWLWGAAAWTVGRTVARTWAAGRLARRGPESAPSTLHAADAVDPATDWALCATLGLGLVAQGLFVLGLAGGFSTGWILAYFVAGHGLAAWILRRRWLACVAVGKRSLPFLAAGFPTVALALYPPTAFDGTVYHLPYATRFLELGRLAFLPELRFPIFPQLAEMTFVPAVLWFGDAAAQLCQALCFVLGGAVVHSWGLRRGGSAGSAGDQDRTVAILCAALWFGLPLMAWTGTSAYVDVELALFVAAGAAAWDRRRYGLAGVFFGFAAATKYLGLFFVAAACLPLLWRRRLWNTRRKGRDLSAPWAFSAAVLLTAGPWYLRQLLVTGNPLFPFYTGLFGDNAWATRHDEVLHSAGSGLASSLAGRVFDGVGQLLTLPWDAVFRREIYHLSAPMSPWYLLLLPALVVWLWSSREKGQSRWLWTVVAYGLFWLTTLREIRFWLPALPLLHLPLALALAGWLGRWTRGTRTLRSPATAIALLLLAPGWGYGVFKLWEAGPLPLDTSTRVAYLNARVPGHAAIDALNRRHPGARGVYALHGERLRHYAAVPFSGDWYGPDDFERVERLVRRPSELRAFLAERSLDHLLLHARHRATPVLRADRHFAVVQEDAEYVLLEVLSTR